ncbi:MAG: NAD(+)/NADH kinase [Oscillospiraceae bacterium]|nr:NAD(+)/NADH kinase [Oscillospiraceae bacterium]
MTNRKMIILSPNGNRDIGFEMTYKVMDILERHGRNVLVLPMFDDDSDKFGLPAGIDAIEFADVVANAEIIITFGGDGTILQAARTAAGPGIPILGVNMGGKGFMADLEIGDIKLIDALAIGEYDIEDRMMLDAEVVRDGAIVHDDFALNDIVLRGDNKVIDLTLYGDGQQISRFSGDGAVVATPTGSTAYSMAAGGPIVEPSAQNIIITPICAHILEAKPFVLVSDRCVSIEVGFKKNSNAYMSADGGNHVGILGGDVINVRKSGKVTRLVRLSDRSFYRKVSEKLGVGQ